MFTPQSLKELRESRKLSQQEFADAVGVTREMVSKMESGAKAISKATQILLADYTKRVNEGTNKPKTNAQDWKDEVIAALKQTAQAEREAKAAEREAKEAYKKVVVLQEEKLVNSSALKDMIEGERAIREAVQEWILEQFARAEKRSVPELRAAMGIRVAKGLGLSRKGKLADANI